MLEAIDNGANLSDDYLRSEVDTFLFEGHDTTSNAMQHTLFMLATYPETQEKVHQELDEIFGSDDRSASMEDLARMKYLGNVFKETLRIFPIVPCITRMADEDILIDVLSS